MVLGIQVDHCYMHGQNFQRGLQYCVLPDHHLAGSVVRGVLGCTEGCVRQR